MKRVISIFLAAIMVISLLPTSIFAAEIVDSGSCGSGVTWALDSDGVLTISGSGEMTYYQYTRYRPWDSYLGSIKEINIADGVTSIGRLAFSNCRKLTSVTIGKDVTSIGGSSFSNCTALTNLVIPDNVISVGSYAFYKCGDITSVTIGNGVNYFGDYAFYDCTNINSVFINDLTAWCGIDFVSSSATPLCYADNFYLGNALITAPVIPDGVTSIGNFAFYDRTSLTSVTIPDSVTSIGNFAFYSCSSLTSVTIPDSVTSIGSSVFSGCSNLTSVAIPDSVTSIGSKAFYGCSSLTSVTIPDSVTSIGSSVFSGCSNLTSVAIPDSVTSIGEKAFYLCNGLTSVTIPSTVIAMEDNAFNGCDSLTNVYINDLAAWCNIDFSEVVSNPLYYGANLYINGMLATDIVIPDGVTTIGEHAFCGCHSLTSVIIPDSVNSIGCEAFRGCSSLKEIVIPNGVTTINQRAFYECEDLEKADLPDSVNSIDREAFRGCSSLKEIVIPNGVTTINQRAFYECENLEKADLPDSVNSIGYEAFRGCSSLKEIVIPNGVTTINYQTFYGCKSLEKVELPDSVNSIDYEAFRGCTNLMELTIPANVTYLGHSAFMRCSSIRSLEIPGSITTIPKKAFYACLSLEDLTIGNGVTSIGEQAFDICGSLTEVVIPESVDSISHRAFYLCGTKFVILNPSCGISDSFNYSYYTIGAPKMTAIYGFADSTAQDYAKRFGYQFVVISSDSVNWERNNLYQLDGMMPITVYSNRVSSAVGIENYGLCSGAEIIYQGNTYTTAENGFVAFPYNGGEITVHKDGYVSRTFSEAALKKSTSINLQKESNCPVISGLWIGNTDILSTEHSVALTDSATETIYTEISWGESTAGSVKLMQGGTSVAIENGTATIKWSDHFDVSKEVSIVATNADGLTSQRKLKLSVLSATPAYLEDFSVNFGDSLSFTLPESAGFFGGTEISAGIYSNIPIAYSIENGKVYAAIGYQSDYKDGEAKSFVDSLKGAYKGVHSGVADYKSVQSAMKAFGGKIARAKGSLGFDTGFTIMGFAEGYLASDGTVQWLDSGMIIGGNVSVGYSFPFYLGPVPMFFEAKLSASVEARANLYIAESAKQFTPNLSLSGEVAISAGLGVGIKNVASVSGGLKGKLKPRWDVSFGKTDYFQLKASWNAYAKVSVLFLDYEKEFDPINEAVWIEYPKKKGTPVVTGVERDFNPYDTSAYEIQDLSYLESGSGFLPQSPAQRAVDISKNTETTLLSNAYTGAEPQIVSLGEGTLLAAWVGSDGIASTNALQLYAAYFDGSAWGEPVLVDDDGTADASPTLEVVSGTAYLAWQDAAQDISDVTTLEELAPLMDISFAVFDPETQSFTVTPIAENDGLLDASPILCGDDTGVYVLWQRNGDNDWFGNSNNSILCRSFDRTAWGEEEILYSDLAMLVSLDACYDGTALHVAYSMDTDGDTGTVEDLEIYENGVRITEDTLLDSGVCYNNGALYWYKDGALVTKDATVISAMSTDHYQFVDQDGVKAIVYTAKDGLYSTLMAIFYDSGSGTWGEPVALTAGNAANRSFAATVQSGNLCLFENRIAVTGELGDADPYGEASLVLVNVPLICDLSVEDIYYNCSEYVEGADMTFDLSLKNHGEIASNGICVKITDEAGTLLSSFNYGDCILPGSVAELTCGFTVDTVTLGQKLNITVTPLNCEDFDLSNNSIEAIMDFKDIALENIAWGISKADKTILSADVVNRSYASSTQDVTVSLRRDSQSGEVLQSTTIGALEPLALEHVSFEVDYEEGAVYYITLTTENQNDSLGNDADFVVLKTEAAEECEHPQSVYIDNRDGTHDQVCSACGEVLIDNEEHSYVDAVCVCGAVEQATDSSLKFKRASLTLQSDFAINFYVLDSVLEGWADPYVVFTKALYDTEGNILGYETETVDVYVRRTTDDGFACHMFTYSGINATEMGSAVTATLYATKDGTVYKGATVNYSVLTYAKNMLAKSSDAELCTMLVDLLNYGAAAQTYFGYNIVNLVNASLTEAQKAFATQTSPVLESYKALTQNEGATVSFKTCTLLLEEKVCLNFYLNLGNYVGDVNDLEAHITYVDSTGKTVEKVIDSAAFDYRLYNRSYYYVVKVDCLNALQMRTVCTAEVFSKTSGERISHTVTYSVESFAYNKATDPDANLVALTVTLMKYGDSVERYFTEN